MYWKAKELRSNILLIVSMQVQVFKIFACSVHMTTILFSDDCESI